MNRQQRKWLIIGVALIALAAVKAGLIYWYLHNKQSKPKPQALACAMGRGACALPGGGSLRFVSPPQHGQPFEVRLEGVTGGAAPTVDFAMPEMDMGFNRYTFVREGAGWKAQVILPMCVSGSRRWVAEVKVGEAAYSLPFNVR
ncbi:hypothetical protein [Chromobacterium sphagni]|uniref:Uncharacterized protein n=1 Tax=Chromobacterium sphagni TaxID=1903179 RepID=A0A1S1X0U9_9NEIS|nr:hypothetical protein [Chromobacterium sphagni]OHX13049.1 hypothetical protein BI347_05620 [Chromobacterium sphagni]OHX19319.1 hypothetical protein BI344_09360 [Chromobacterium sphagni]